MQNKHLELHAMRSRIRGFSMVEVLVSLIIIAVGMLGLAKIQALAYASTGIASQQSIAALQAASIASAMRANHGYWSTGNNPNNIGMTTAYIYTNPVGSTANTDSSLSTIPTCTSATAGKCTPAQMAAYDLNNWVTAINNVLPHPTATISCPIVGTNAQLGCLVTITWMEANTGMNVATSGSMGTPSYTLYVVL